MRFSYISLPLALVAGGQYAEAAHGGKPVYKDSGASIDSRVNDLLGRMSIQEKMAQLIQGDMTNYLDLTTGAYNASGLAWTMNSRANSIWTGLYTDMGTVKKAAKLAYDYVRHNTTLGEPPLFI